MKRFLFIFCFFIFVSAFIFSQDSNSGLLEKLVEKNILTQEEADELINEQAKEKEPEGVIGKSCKKINDIFPNTPYLRLGGYGMLMYQYRQYNPSHHNLSARVIFISARGQLTDNLSYFILGELVNPMIYEYYAEWAPLKEIRIRGGQFKVPFTLENPVSLTALETVTNTRSVSALAGMADDPLYFTNYHNKTGRDLGFQLSGSLFNKEKFDLLQYAFGVFQGQGMNVSDKNNNKDFAGTLAVQPVYGLKVAGGLYLGEATYRAAGEYEQKSHVRNRWALSAEYSGKNLYARSEWIHGNDGGIDKEGLYGTAMYYLTPKMNIMGKVDYYNNNKDNNSEVMDYTIGVNYYFFNDCRFMLNYTFSDYSKRWESQHRTENAVFAQMQIVF